MIFFKVSSIDLSQLFWRCRHSRYVAALVRSDYTTNYVYIDKVSFKTVLEVASINRRGRSWDFRNLIITRCSAIAERPRCKVRYIFRQKWNTGTGRQYFTDIIHRVSKNIHSYYWL